MSLVIIFNIHNRIGANLTKGVINYWRIKLISFQSWKAIRYNFIIINSISPSCSCWLTSYYQSHQAWIKCSTSSLCYFHIKIISTIDTYILWNYLLIGAILSKRYRILNKITAWISNICIILWYFILFYCTITSISEPRQNKFSFIKTCIILIN